MQEKETLMGHRLEIGIFNPRDDRDVWYLGGASVPPDRVIPRVENADLKSMPIVDSNIIIQHFASDFLFSYLLFLFSSPCV